MDTGEPTSSDLLLRRAAIQQGSCFTLTPILDGSWEVGGVFCSVQPKEDMVAFRRFHRLGSMFFSAPSKIEPLLLEIVDVAMDITGSDFGNIQLVDPGTSDLRIVAQRGFESWWLDFWNTVSAGQGTCGTALERGERVVVEDVERSPIFVGTPALEIQQRAGVKAVISTPLVSRSSKPIGMFSVHFRSPQRFTDETLHRLDLLARHAADIVERAMAEEALRQSEARSRALADERGQLVERLGEAMRFAEQFMGIVGATIFAKSLSAIRVSADVLNTSEIRDEGEGDRSHRVELRTNDEHGRTIARPDAQSTRGRHHRRTPAHRARRARLRRD